MGDVINLARKGPAPGSPEHLDAYIAFEKLLPFHGDKQLSFNVRLASILGMKEAILLTDLHYLIYNFGTNIRSVKWMRLTYDDWCHELGNLWGRKTLHTAISGLVDKGILISKALNKDVYDRTLWYRIDYEVLNNYCSEHECTLRKGVEDEPIEDGPGCEGI